MLLAAAYTALTPDVQAPLRAGRLGKDQLGAGVEHHQAGGGGLDAAALEPEALLAALAQRLGQPALREEGIATEAALLGVQHVHVHVAARPVGAAAGLKHAHLAHRFVVGDQRHAAGAPGAAAMVAELRDLFGTGEAEHRVAQLFPAARLMVWMACSAGVYFGLTRSAVSNAARAWARW